MKLRDSGMPEESYWETLFDVPKILSSLNINSQVRDVAELGCGYGTFTLPIARAISGTIYTFDIESEMVERTKQRAADELLSNVECRQRDVMELGFGLTGTVDAALLFNILHCNDPRRLIGHAIDVLRPGGRLLVIHWRHDPATPRGPSLEIRPKPEQIVGWTFQSGLIWQKPSLDLPPWHFGLTFKLDCKT